MADGFESNAEIAAKQVDIVAKPFGDIQEGSVGQYQRASEIIRQADPRQRPSLVVRQRRVLYECIHQGREFEECQLRRHLERLLAGPQPARQPQHPGRGIEPAVYAGTLLVTKVSQPQAVLRFKPRGERRSHPADGHSHFLGDGFGGAVEFVDVIVPGIEEVAHLLERCRGQRQVHARPVIAESRRIGRCLLGRLFQLPALGDEGARQCRHVRHQLSQIGCGDRLGSSRIEHSFAQFAEQPGVVILGEKLDIHPEGGVEPKQHGHRQGPLVVLDLVEIARRDADAPGEAGLGEAVGLAQLADLAADEQLGVTHFAVWPIAILQTLDYAPPPFQAFSRANEGFMRDGTCFRRIS